MMKVNSIRWGVILCGIGIVFLAVNFGYLSGYIWITLLSLWPVFLIAVGIEWTFKYTSLKYLGLLSPLLIIIAFIYAASTSWDNESHVTWRFPGYHDSSYRREVYNFDVENDTLVKNLKVKIDYGMGELWIGSSSDKLFSGDFEYRYKKPRCRYNLRGNTGDIKISTRDHRIHDIFRKRDLKNDTRIFIADYIPLDIDLKIGAAQVELDLSDLIVEKLNLDTGAAQTEIRLGSRSKEIELDIDSGVSQVIIEVPRDMGLEIDSDAALSSTNFRRAGLEKHHSKYRSPDFDSADCKTYIKIDSGVSQIEIDYY